MDGKKHSNIPPSLAIACGLAVGASLGRHAGEAIAETGTPHLPHALQGHSGALAHVAEIGTAFGGAFIGHLLAVEKPAEAVFLAIAAAPTILSKAHEHSVGADKDHTEVNEPAGISSGIFQTEPDTGELEGGPVETVWYPNYTSHQVPHGALNSSFHDGMTLFPHHASPAIPTSDADGEIIETGLHLL